MLGKQIKLGSVVGSLGRDTNRYASHGTLRIAYELLGTMHRRRPWLVLIQGMGFDRSGWEPVLPALRRRFRLVLVDNRGTGRSGRPAGSFAVADMAGDVVAVLDDAGIGRAHVLGASLGGMVAQELAITWPERVGRLVLACTTPGWPASYPMPAASLRLIMVTRGMPVEAARRRHTEHALSAQAVQRNPALVGRLMEVQGVRPVGQEVLSAQAMAGARYAGRLRLGRIGARALVVHGSADAVVDPRNARLLAGRITGASLVTFPGLGHLLFWEDPAGFAAAVTSFLLDADDGHPGHHGADRAERGVRHLPCGHPARRPARPLSTSDSLSGIWPCRTR
jgi:pimeloyl-ACP methyl ester carboxylesterase